MHTVEELEEHTTSKHKYEVSVLHLDSLLELCCIPDPTKACGRCIFCNHQLASDKLYISHVTSHLEQLALHALPLLDYDHDPNIDGYEKVDNQIDDDKSGNTNSESKEEESDQGQVNTDDNDEYEVHEESAGEKEDPKDLPAQSGWGKSFHMEILQRPAKTVCEAYVDPQISKLLKDEWGSYHGLVSGDLFRSREDYGDPLDFYESFGDESLLKYKGIYVKAIAHIFWKVNNDVPRSGKKITSLHLLICSDLPGGMNVILKDNLEGLSGQRGFESDTKAEKPIKTGGSEGKFRKFTDCDFC